MDYIKTTSIVAEIIPRHSNFATLPKNVAAEYSSFRQVRLKLSCPCADFIDGQSKLRTGGKDTTQTRVSIKSKHGFINVTTSSVR